MIKFLERSTTGLHSSRDNFGYSIFAPDAFKSANFNIKHVTHASHARRVLLKANKKTLYLLLFVRPPDLGRDAPKIGI